MPYMNVARAQKVLARHKAGDHSWCSPRKCRQAAEAVAEVDAQMEDHEPDLVDKLAASVWDKMVPPELGPLNQN